MIPAIGAALYQRLWELGYGRIDVSKSGQMLDRSYVDSSVWQGERLDFCAPPGLGEGLERRAPEPVIYPGAPMLCTAGMEPGLSMAEWRASGGCEHLRQAKKEAQAEAKKKRKAYIKEWLAAAKKNRPGVSLKRERRMITQAVEQRILPPDFPLTHESGSIVFVSEILANPDRWNGERFADPLEPGYRDDSRVAWLSLGSDPYLYSHAHGGIRYALCHEVADIEIVSGERPRAVDETLTVMRGCDDLYERGGEIVRVVNGVPVPLDVDALGDYLGRKIRYLQPYKNRDTGEIELRRIDVPPQLCKALLSKKKECWGLRELRRVVTAPTLRLDGNVLAKPGYDENSKILLHGGGFIRVPVYPTQDELKRAAALLWLPFGKFPFNEKSDAGALLAAIFTVLTRHCYPLAPGFNFDAPVAGIGKTLLAMCVQLLAGMEPLATSASEDDDAELRKKVTSFFRKGRSCLLLDNIRGAFSSSTLEMLLTCIRYNDRKLGANEDFDFTNDITVLISGNNFIQQNDLFRRLISCRIDAKRADPERRTFEIRPAKQCAGNRRAMVSAALTLFRGFIAAGKPRDKDAGGHIGSFEEWDDLVRQCVIWVGGNELLPVSDPAVCIQQAKDQDPGRQKLAVLLHAVREIYGDKSWRSQDLIICSEEREKVSGFSKGALLHSELREVLDEIAGERGVINPRRLGRWIEAHRDIRSDGMWLSRDGTFRRAVTWRVSKDGSEKAHVDNPFRDGDAHAEVLH
jgi:hypothetical protein